MTQTHYYARQGRWPLLVTLGMLLGAAHAQAPAPALASAQPALAPMQAQAAAPVSSPAAVSPSAPVASPTPAPAGAPASDQARPVSLPRCVPLPKMLHDEIPPPESFENHSGLVKLTFTIDPEGHVHDPKVENTTDEWLNDPAVMRVLKRLYEPVKSECRMTQLIKFDSPE